LPAFLPKTDLLMGTVFFRGTESGGGKSALEFFVKLASAGDRQHGESSSHASVPLLLAPLRILKG